MESTKNQPKPNAGSDAQMDGRSIQATAQQTGLFVQVDEEFKARETAIQPMTLKEKTDLSKLREMLTDARSHCTGTTKSTYRVLFYTDRIGQKFAVKIFPRGKYQQKAEEDFKHESRMHIEALTESDSADSFAVLAIEMGCGPLPITLPSGEKVFEYNYIMTH